MNEQEIKLRTNKFAHRCVKLAVALPNTFLGNHIKGQLILASTSVTANYRAACLAQSKAAFIAKISIVIEEADESAFWLEFIIDENLIIQERAQPLFIKAQELTAIFVKSRITAEKNKNNKQ